jgi:hypothetical protein
MPADDQSGHAATGACTYVMLSREEANESFELDHHGLVCAPSEFRCFNAVRGGRAIKGR